MALAGQRVLSQHSQMSDLRLLHAGGMFGKREERCLQHAARGAGPWDPQKRRGISGAL